MSEDYPPGWNKLRRIIYKRDNYRCVNCGAKGDIYGDTELHAHHIVPKSAGGKDVANKKNLATLCNECHSFTHGGQIRGMCDAEQWHSDKKILERENFECQNCGERPEIEGDTFSIININGLEFHYIVPLDSGGQRKKSNIAVLCRSCHQKSHT